MLVPKLAIPSAPVSASTVLSVVYHSDTVQLASVGLHSTVAVTSEPSHADAVNTTLPAALNVTFPLYGSIVATVSSDEDQTTVLLVASLFTVADNVTATPTVSTFELLEILISDTGVAAGTLVSG